MTVRRPVLLAALASALVLAAPTVATAAPPPRIACGTTLTTDTVLRHDLTCPGDGLRLAAGVTLDLKNHTLRGSGGGVGVLVHPDGASAILHGRLTGWGTAVDTEELEDDTDYEGGGTLRVDKVRFHANGTGVDASGQEATGRFVKRTTITRSTFTGHTEALGGNWFAVIDVDDSTFTDNRMVVFSGGNVSFTGTRFERNEAAIVGTEANIDVAGSTFVDNPVAIRTHYGAHVDVDGSTFTGSEVAVHAERSSVDVRRSTFTGNTRALVLGEWGGTVADNTLRDNDEAIVTDGTVDDWYESVLVERNVLRRNGDGIVLELRPGAVSLRGNDVRSGAGWGIYAPGAVDLGGNRAISNRNDPQCVGVVCRMS